jgi:hypothetical protein
MKEKKKRKRGVRPTCLANHQRSHACLCLKTQACGCAWESRPMLAPESLDSCLAYFYFYFLMSLSLPPLSKSNNTNVIQMKFGIEIKCSKKRGIKWDRKWKVGTQHLWKENYEQEPTRWWSSGKSLGQEVCSLCGLRFELYDYSYDGHWRLTWLLTSGPVKLVEMRVNWSKHLR